MKSNRIAVIAGLALASLAGQAQSQAYPSRPVTLINPYAAGGISDVAFRAMAQEVSKTFGQNIVVENRTGAGGKVGANAIMQAPKDGYTIGIFNSAIATNLAVLDPNFQILPGKDYAPVTRAIETYVIMVASPGAPAKDVKSLLEYARANPGKLNVGTSGVGTTGHLSFELLQHLGKIRMTHVPYKGDAPAILDVVSGQIPYAFNAATTSKPQIDAGKVVPVAVSGAKRWSVFPTVPSFQEAGLPNFDAAAWLGIVGPAGMAAEPLARVNRAFVAALQVPELRKRLEDMGLAVQSSTPDEFTAFIRRDHEVWSPILKAAGIKVD